MKRQAINRNSLLTLFTSSLLLISTVDVAASDVGNLTIQMQGIQTNQGQAIFVLMDSASSHTGKSPVFNKKIVTIYQLNAKVNFTNIPEGDYSAVVYHDINGNEDLDRYFFGMPKEPYGFSNNARNPFGIPEFAESSFQVTANNSIQTISIQ